MGAPASTPTGIDQALNQLQHLDTDDLEPRCEVVRRCDGSVRHRAHDFTCDRPAAWVAFFVCEHGARTEIFICQDCHDGILANGNQALDHEGKGVQLEWRPL